MKLGATNTILEDTIIGTYASPFSLGGLYVDIQKDAGYT